MKKFLSLVLALVMTMSLVTVSAGAQDFTDDGDITYKEAVDVISALDIVDGYSDDSFRPDGVLTRGAAAKIICNLILGPTTAEALSAGTAPFKDVPVTNTFAGYITYCSQQGIISGYADGTFRPTGTLSGNAFMKMLLGALGYDSSIEGYTGANWQVNVIKQAVGIGLDDGNDNFVGSQAVTREEAALYAFNMLQATMVEYEQQSTINVGGVEIVTSSARSDRANTTSSDGNIGDADRLMQFAELYFSDLVERDGTTDAFERPSTTWRLKSTTIGTYANEADATYTATVKVGDIYSDLGLDDGIDDTDVTLYVDGHEETWAAGDVVRGSRTNATSTGNGALTEVYYDDDADTVTVVVTNTYVGKIGSVRSGSSTRDAYVTLDTSDDNFTSPTGFRNNFDTEDFDKDDIVTYTYSRKTGENCIQSMELAEAVTGTMSRYTTEGSVTVAGTEYDANVASKAKIQTYVPSVDRSDEVTIYLDQYGYVVYVDADVEVNYAVVLGYEGSNSLDSARARLLFTDGTTKVVEVQNGITPLTSGFATPTIYGAGLSKYDIVSYTVDSDDVYNITVVADAVDGNDGGAFVLKNGGNDFSIAPSNATNKTDDSPKKTTHYADGKTIFLVADTSGSKTTYSVYEGIANVPTINKTGSSNNAVTVFMDSTTSDTPAKVIFIEKDSTVTMSSDNQDVVYVKGSNTDRSYTSELGDFYEYDAYINGDPTTVKVAYNSTMKMTTDSLIYGPIYNEKGIMTGFTGRVVSSVNASGVATPDTDPDMVFTQGVKSVVNDVITLGTRPYAYTRDVEVYYIDEDGNLEAMDITSVAEDDDDLVFFKTNSDGLVTDLYVKELNVAESVTPGAGVLDDVVLWKSGTSLAVTVETTAVLDTVNPTSIGVVVEEYMKATNTWVPVYTGSVTIAANATSAAVTAVNAPVANTIYRATATYNGGTLTCANFTW